MSTRYITERPAIPRDDLTFVNPVRSGCAPRACTRDEMQETQCRDTESGKRSLPAGAAVKGVRARVAPGGNLTQPAEVISPAFRMAGALLGIGQAGVGQAQAAFRPAAVPSGRSRPGLTPAAPS